MSLGDERVAEPGARLIYHNARATNASELTASETTALHSALRELDDGMIALLATRALNAPGDAPKVRHKSERSDRKRPRAPARARHSSPASPKMPSKRRRLARERSDGLSTARCRDGDQEALTALYRRLFEVEAPISARLALTLRLIDRIGSRTAESVPASRAPRVSPSPSGGVLFPPHGDVPRELLTRHTLVLGETGAGKTASCMLPVVSALARTPPERLGGALVIDPKLELGPALERLAPERLHHVAADRAVVNLMAGPRWSLEEDLAAREMAERRGEDPLSCRLVRALEPGPGADGPHAGLMGQHRVLQPGGHVARGCRPRVRPHGHLARRSGPPSAGFDDDVGAYLWVGRPACSREGSTLRPARTERARARRVGARRAAARSTGRGRLLHLAVDAGRRRPTWLFARIAKGLLSHLGEDPDEARDVLRRVIEYWEPMARVRGQYAGVRATAATICADFASSRDQPDPVLRVRAGVPRRDKRNGLDFARLVSRDGPGTLVLFQPARDGLDNLIAVALKASFFEAVLDDPDRARGGKDLPLVAYLSRTSSTAYITSDPLHGEQSFLDTCRSLRRVLRPRLAIRREPGARARQRGRVFSPGRERGRDPVEQHGEQAGLQDDGSKDREPGGRSLSAPTGPCRGGAGAPGLDPAGPASATRCSRTGGSSADSSPRLSPAPSLRSIRMTLLPSSTTGLIRAGSMRTTPRERPRESFLRCPTLGRVG